MSDERALDNPVFASLATRHASIAEGGALARRYPPDVSPLGALAARTDACAEAMVALVAVGDEVGVAGPQLPSTPRGFELIRTIEIVQMIRRDPAPLDTPRIAFDELGARDIDAMLELVALTRPGPFCRRTIELGRFVGVREGDQLIAMAGERLWIDDHREVSGVCTHPDAQGRGMARALMAEVVNRMLARRQVPFLHAETSKPEVIRFYESLGFARRLDIAVTAYRRAA
jgi:ribosomal protein S18 acetylase RimI-like enzyme